MSVKVNLLPGEVAKRGEANRSRALAAGVFLLLLVVLAGATLLQRQRLGDAQDRLAAVEAANTELRADIATLQPFAELEQRATQAADTVVVAMGGEISIAGILQDLSAATPPGVELGAISLNVFDAPQAPTPGGDRLVYGTLSASGRVVGLVPGVERLLIDFGRVAAFDNVYIGSATTDEDGLTSFSLEAELGIEILTGRYTIDGAQS